VTDGDLSIRASLLEALFACRVCGASFYVAGNHDETTLAREWLRSHRRPYLAGYSLLLDSWTFHVGLIEGVLWPPPPPHLRLRKR
jgi:hypothetical protein